MNEILLSTGKLVCWVASTFTGSSVCPSLSQQLFVGQVLFGFLILVTVLTLARKTRTA